MTKPFSLANAWKYSGSLPVLVLMLSMYALYVIALRSLLSDEWSHGAPRYLFWPVTSTCGGQDLSNLGILSRGAPVRRDS